MSPIGNHRNGFGANQKGTNAHRKWQGSNAVNGGAHFIQGIGGEPKIIFIRGVDAAPKASKERARLMPGKAS